MADPHGGQGPSKQQAGTAPAPTAESLSRPIPVSVEDPPPPAPAPAPASAATTSPGTRRAEDRVQREEDYSLSPSPRRIVANRAPARSAASGASASRSPSGAASAQGRDVESDGEESVEEYHSGDDERGPQRAGSGGAGAMPHRASPAQSLSDEGGRILQHPSAKNLVDEESRSRSGSRSESPNSRSAMRRKIRERQRRRRAASAQAEDVAASSSPIGSLSRKRVSSSGMSAGMRRDSAGAVPSSDGDAQHSEASSSSGVEGTGTGTASAPTSPAGESPLGGATAASDAGTPVARHRKKTTSPPPIVPPTPPGAGLPSSASGDAVLSPSLLPFSPTHVESPRTSAAIKEALAHEEPLDPPPSPRSRLMPGQNTAGAAADEDYEPPLTCDEIWFEIRAEVGDCMDWTPIEVCIVILSLLFGAVTIAEVSLFFSIPEDAQAVSTYQALGALSAALLGVFTLETLLKILAFGLGFLRVWRNIADLLVVFIAFGLQVAAVNEAFVSAAIVASALAVASRVFRLLVVVSRQKRCRDLWTTLRTNRIRQDLSLSTPERVLLILRDLRTKYPLTDVTRCSSTGPCLLLLPKSCTLGSLRTRG